jgi:hypothetical protein
VRLIERANMEFGKRTQIGDAGLAQNEITDGHGW